MESDIYPSTDILPDELLLQVEHVLREEDPVGRVVESVSHSSTRVYNILLTCHRSSPSPPQTDSSCWLTRIDLWPVSPEQ